jgi:hypothetical protein
VAVAGTQTVLQTAVDEAMRDRVLGLFRLIFRGGPAAPPRRRRPALAAAG